MFRSALVAPRMMPSWCSLVYRLEDPVGGSGPGRNSRVARVEPVEGLPLVIGHGQRSALQRLSFLVSSGHVQVEEPSPLCRADGGGAEGGDLGGEVVGEGVDHRQRFSGLAGFGVGVAGVFDLVLLLRC